MTAGPSAFERALSAPEERKREIGPEDTLVNLTPQEVAGVRGASLDPSASIGPETGARQPRQPVGVPTGTPVDSLFASQFAVPEEGRASNPQTDDETLNAIKRTTGNIAASTAAAFATRGASLVPQMIAQLSATGLTEYVMRLNEGMSHTDAFGHAAEVGAMDAGMEAVAPGLSKVGELAAPAVRKGFRGARDAVRGARGLPPMPKDPGIRSFKRPFTDYFVANPNRVFDDLQAEGTLPPPGQLIENLWVDRMQGIAEQGIFSGPAMGNRRLGAIRASNKAIRRLVSEFPDLKPEEAARLFDDLRTGRLVRIKGIAQARYTEVDELLKADVIETTVPKHVREMGPDGKMTTRMAGHETKRTITKNGVDIRSVKQFLEERIKDRKGILPERFNKVERILAMDDVITYSEAQKIRTDLFDISGQFNPNRDPILKRERALASGMSRELTDRINEAAEAAGPGVKALLIEANDLWRREIKGEITSKVVSDLFRKQPEDMIRALLSGDVGTVKMVRNIVEKERPGSWEGVQGVFFNELIREAEDPALVRTMIGGQQYYGINGAKLNAVIEPFKKMDQAKLRAFFPTKHDRQALDGFLQWAETLGAMQRPAGQDMAATVFFQLGQAGVIGAGAAAGWGMAFGEGEAPAGLAGAAAGFVLAPWAFSRIMRNPEMVKWMIKGAEAMPGSRAAKRAVLVLGSYIGRENMLANDDDRPLLAQTLTRARDDLRAMGTRDRPASKRSSPGDPTMRIAPAAVP